MAGIDDLDIPLGIQSELPQSHLGIAIGAGSRRAAADSLAAQLFGAPDRAMAEEEELVGSQARHHGKSLPLERDGAHNRFGISQKDIDLSRKKFRHSLRARTHRDDFKINPMVDEDSLVNP